MSLVDSFTETRQFSESLCSPLSTEDYVPQLVEYASPPKWHLAHTTWFFEEMILKKYVSDYSEYDSTFSYLFNSYYNTVGDRLARVSRGVITKPDVADVYAYRKYVDSKILDLLQSPISTDIEKLLILGINHEQQHQELLMTDLKYTLGHNPIFPTYEKNKNLVDNFNLETGLLSIDEGIYEIGYQGEGFHFDNEVNRHKVYLNAFQINKALVSNAEYMEFIDAGGYTEFQYWLDDGWHWLNQNQIKAPLYWHKIDNVWHYYTLAGLKPVNPDAILCHISFFEANAFANWKGMRLPTEMEWEIASSQLPWGLRWEWTNSAYLPYPDFKISEGAVGEYNGKFMINQMVLRGASVVTPKGHSRMTYRNFFQAQLQWQYSGIRLVS